VRRRRRGRAAPAARVPESPYAGAGAGEELFGALSNREILARAGLTFALCSCTLLLRLGCAAFALLYVYHLGLRMVFGGAGSFARFGRARGTYHRGDALWGAFFLAVLWLLLVALPVLGMWAPLGQIDAAETPRRSSVTLAALGAGLDQRVLALALLLLAAELYRARVEARQPEEPGPTLFKPVLARALCVAAFVFFGPTVYVGLREAGLDEPAAVAVTYALSETYPFVATLIDRLLHRAWPR
jgi:hypothetical protein